MASSPVQPPTKPCHNCRRQRLRCDRSYPHCNKCAAAGKECLGYGKLFRWTGAIASRGKLAGRTSSAPLDHPDAGSPPGMPAMPVMSVMSVTSSVTPATPATPDDRSSSESDDSPPPPRDTVLGSARRSSTHADAGWATAVQHVPRVRVSTPWVLIDPLFQDLNPSHRYYLSYFTNRLCKDLVSQDLPGCNPFRSLLPLTKTHPLLQYIIVAASAAHLSNLFKSGLPSAQGNALISSHGQDSSRRALNDALVAKHKALHLMHAALQDIDGTGGDVVLAAAIFFINVELIESGKHGWRAHLEGAAKIMSVLPPTNTWDSALRDYLLSDCFIYFIFGSAFTPAVTTLSFEPFQIPFVLEKTVANCYLCCPPEILEILHAASQLSNVEFNDGSADQVTAIAGSLLERARAVDINAWAVDLRGMSHLQHVSIDSRVHAASAHQLAACLYILQAIPSVSERVESGFAESLSQDIFGHLSSIPADDPNFKAITWPTFIAGAETTSPERQAWVVDRLRRLVSICPWGFINTAMDTLQAVWSLRAKDRGSRSWVQTLKDPDLNFLIV